jgi:hypothetical protein
MRYVKIYLLAARQLLNSKNYLFGLSILPFIIFWFLLYIPVRTIPGNDFAFQVSLLTVKDRILLGTLSLLTALSILMNIYVLRNKPGAQTGLATAGQGGTGLLSGVIGSVFGTATCASCVASIFGFLGVGGVFFLLQYRSWITTASIILILVSLYFTSRKVLGICESCKVRK